MGLAAYATGNPLSCPHQLTTHHLFYPKSIVDGPLLLWSHQVLLESNNIRSEVTKSLHIIICYSRLPCCEHMELSLIIIVVAVIGWSS